MTIRSRRNRLSDSTNIWPGFVDVLATLLIVIIFILMVFTVSQIYLSDAISGRDRVLSDLKKQINELSKILVIETEKKQEALSSLSQTQEELGQTKQELQSEQSLSEQLQSDISKKRSEIFVQEQNIIALSDQIGALLQELRIVARALETYEGAEIALIETKGLGEKINKALATRIDQLKALNNQLDDTNKKLEISEKNLTQKVDELDLLNNKLVENEKELEIKISELDKKNQNLQAINESLGLDDASLVEQLEAIKNKNNELLKLNEKLVNSQQETQEALRLVEDVNTELSIRNDELVKLNEKLVISQEETETALRLVEDVNTELSIRDEQLQNQIIQYQQLTNELLTINDSLGLKDATLQKQLDAIRYKNQELENLNKNLIEKDNTIFSLRGKILELDNILSLSEEKQIAQQSKILTQEREISSLSEISESEKQQSLKTIKQMELRSSQTLEQVALLTNEIDILKNEITLLNNALEASEQTALTKDLKIEVLGERLNKALTSKVFELQKYRSEFFGKLQNILGDREDIKIKGDRFIIESELLFDSASADLQLEGKEKLREIGKTLKETTTQIPNDIDWVILVEGHTDKRPIKTVRYPSNWELSTARANSVLKLLLELGFNPSRLAAAGYGEFYPISNGNTDADYQQNRRIELKLTSR